MIVIGEKINTSIKPVQTAVQNYDDAFIKDIAKKQMQNGAGYLDVNCGTFLEDESVRMKWLIEVVQDTVDIPLCIDSPNPKAIEEGLKVNKKESPIINSITAEKDRWESILPLIVNYKTKIIALCMDDNGIPENPEGRVDIARRMAEEMARKGINEENIYFDPMVQPVSTDSRNALVTLETIKKIRQEIPKANVVCGLSNISYGLPARKLLNQSFVVAAVLAGLGAAIIDPLDRRLMSLVYAADTIAGNDDYCMNFIGKYREGSLEV